MPNKMKNFISPLPCEACGFHPPNVYHHLYTRKSRPDLKYEPDNLISLCVNHHTHGKDAIHNIGRQSFIKRFKLEEFMRAKGWEMVGSKWVYIENS